MTKLVLCLLAIASLGASEIVREDAELSPEVVADHLKNLESITRAGRTFASQAAVRGARLPMALMQQVGFDNMRYIQAWFFIVERSTDEMLKAWLRESPFEDEPPSGLRDMIIDRIMNMTRSSADAGNALLSEESAQRLVDALVEATNYQRGLVALYVRLANMDNADIPDFLANNTEEVIERLRSTISRGFQLARDDEDLSRILAPSQQALSMILRSLEAKLEAAAELQPTGLSSILSNEVLNLHRLAQTKMTQLALSTIAWRALDDDLPRIMLRGRPQAEGEAEMPEGEMEMPQGEEAEEVRRPSRVGRRRPQRILPDRPPASPRFEERVSMGWR